MDEKIKRSTSPLQERKQNNASFETVPKKAKREKEVPKVSRVSLKRPLKRRSDESPVILAFDVEREEKKEVTKEKKEMKETKKVEGNESFRDMLKSFERSSSSDAKRSVEASLKEVTDEEERREFVRLCRESKEEVYVVRGRTGSVVVRVEGSDWRLKTEEEEERTVAMEVVCQGGKVVCWNAKVCSARIRCVELCLPVCNNLFVFLCRSCWLDWACGGIAAEDCWT